MPLNILSFRACLIDLQEGMTRGGLYACHLILYACQSKLMQVRYPLCYKLQKNTNFYHLRVALNKFTECGREKFAPLLCCC